MGTPEQWLQVLAWTKALFESTKAAIDLGETYEKYFHDPETIRESRRVSLSFSTYTEEEVESLITRLKGCRDRFIQQGGGADRSRCICSVLREAQEGNGGTLPEIDDWENIYRQLRCHRFEE